MLLPFAKRAAWEIGHRFREGTNPRSLHVRDWLSLTDAERTVAHLAAQGLPSRVVADRLLMSQPTVRAHLRHVFRKLVTLGLQVRAAEVSVPPGDAELKWELAYYILSEALANVAKHAKAGMVEVRVEAGVGVLSLSVRDEGVGGADPDSSGLAGLRERTEALGGTLELTSPPGRGTSVHVRLPVAAR